MIWTTAGIVVSPASTRCSRRIGEHARLFVYLLGVLLLLLLLLVVPRVELCFCIAVGGVVLDAGMVMAACVMYA